MPPTADTTQVPIPESLRKAIHVKMRLIRKALAEGMVDDLLSDRYTHPLHPNIMAMALIVGGCCGPEIERLTLFGMRLEAAKKTAKPAAPDQTAPDAHPPMPDRKTSVSPTPEQPSFGPN